MNASVESVVGEEQVIALFDIAKRCAYRYCLPHRGVEYDDLLQETMLHILEQIGSYYDDKDTTYAFVDRVTRNMLSNLLLKNATFHLSTGQYRAMMNILITRRKMAHYLREVTPEDVADEMRIPVSVCKSVLDCAEIMEAFSLDAPAYHGEKRDVSLGETLPSSAVYSDPEEVAIIAALQETINTVIESLDGLEKTTIRLRYGLNRLTIDPYYHEDMNQFEVADELKISVADERCLEIQAMRKLRHPSRSSLLEPFL